MKLLELEKAKVTSSEVKHLEKTLTLIEREEEALSNEFDYFISSIMGSEFLSRLSYETKPDAKTFRPIPLFSEIRNQTVRVDGKKVTIPCGFLSVVHKSYIQDEKTKAEYEEKIKTWFQGKTEELREKLEGKNTEEEVNRYLPEAYALASLALTVFHKNPNMKLHEVQKLTGIAISEGDIAELGTGEGKTLAAVLPVFLQALRGKGAHVITANSYLSRRDYEEVLPIFEGLGVSIGFVPEDISELAMIEGLSMEQISQEDRIRLEKKLKELKKEAYQKEITYGSKASFAFDYLRDTTVKEKEDLVGRKEKLGFALIDEVDDVLIDGALNPYILSSSIPTYRENMTVADFALTLGTPLSSLYQKMEEIGIDSSKVKTLDYDSARYLSMALYSKELLPEQTRYQDYAQRFFESVEQNIFEVKDGMFGLSGKELYRVLTSKDEKLVVEGDREATNRLNEEIEKIRANASIISYGEQSLYQISDACYEEFLLRSYLSFQLNSVIREHESALLLDEHYVMGKDYQMVAGHPLLTYSAAKRLLSDPLHPEFSLDFDRHMKSVQPFASELLHTFEQAVRANLVMKEMEDYVVVDGKVKVVQNGRIQEGSTYSDGLQQALEAKEKVPLELRSQENETVASITQKEFYKRYDMFSGMTGTSSKKVFQEVFDKETVSIPRHAIYRYFSPWMKKEKRNTSLEPLGVEKKDTVFARTREDKISLMIDSIRSSQAQEPKQPVLLVVSNPEELQLLDEALKKSGIRHTMLEASVGKSKEAEIIAKAGLPGAVTISTEMAGRGTDIKLGGDRSTILDIATKRHMDYLERKYQRSIPFTVQDKEILRKKVEEALVSKGYLWMEEQEQRSRESLENSGLKVISSGYFKMDRIDRQLEGRTGRNGTSGSCERFASLEDFEFIGISTIDRKRSLKKYFSHFAKREDKSLVVDSRSYHQIASRIEDMQKTNEDMARTSIIETQEVSNLGATMMERYREKRRNILFGEVDLDQEISHMYESVVDHLLTSYTDVEQFSRRMLLSPIESGLYSMDLPLFALEVKDVLGLDLDTNSLKDANLLELRDALLGKLQERREGEKEKNPSIQRKKEENALLTSCDYVISNLPSVISLSSNAKRLTSMSMGMENMADYTARTSFVEEMQRVRLDSGKRALQVLVGKTLSKEEQEKLEQGKEKLFGLQLQKNVKEDSYDVFSSRRKENQPKEVEEFRKAKDKAIRRHEKKKKKKSRAISKKIEKGNVNAARKIYSSLDIRPYTLLLASENQLALQRESLISFALREGKSLK